MCLWDILFPIFFPHMRTRFGMNYLLILIKEISELVRYFFLLKKKSQFEIDLFKYQVVIRGQLCV